MFQSRWIHTFVWKVKTDKLIMSCEAVSELKSQIPLEKEKFYRLEICVDNVASAKAASFAGADRLELCHALDLGGLTPSPGLIAAIRDCTCRPIYMLVRPRAGNFVYTDDEIDIMKKDIESGILLGMDGFVFGALSSNNKIDRAACCKLMIAAGGRPVTFHRAFDLTEDDRELNEVITLGFKTILTSGRCKTASEGISTIKNLIDRAGSEISIMPGSGINPLNIKRIAEETGAEEFHSSGQDPERRPVIVEDFVVKGTTSYPLSDEFSVKKMRKILDELQFQDKTKYY